MPVNGEAVIHPTSLVALHEQPAAVCTTAVDAPPAAGAEKLVGEIAYVHPGVGGIGVGVGVGGGDCGGGCVGVGAVPD